MEGSCLQNTNCSLAQQIRDLPIFPAAREPTSDLALITILNVSRPKQPSTAISLDLC